MSNAIWKEPGATLTEGTAQKEFGLSQRDIYQAVREGKLQFREASIFGNPCLRLLRHEVEKLVADNCGGEGLKRKQLENELVKINRKLRKLKKDASLLEKRRTELARLLGE